MNYEQRVRVYAYVYIILNTAILYVYTSTLVGEFNPLYWSFMIRLTLAIFWLVNTVFTWVYRRSERRTNI